MTFLRTIMDSSINPRFVREIMQRKNQHGTWDTIAEMDDGTRVVLMPSEAEGVTFRFVPNTNPDLVVLAAWDGDDHIHFVEMPIIAWSICGTGLDMPVSVDDFAHSTWLILDRRTGQWWCTADADGVGDAKEHLTEHINQDRQSVAERKMAQ